MLKEDKRGESMPEVVYMRVLTLEKLMGWKNCDIRYVVHNGNYNDISLEAYKRNIILVPISLRRYRAESGKRW